MPDAFDAKTFYVCPNAAPSPLAGKQCNPFFFAASLAERRLPRGGRPVRHQQGLKNVYLIAPNYQAGKDSLDRLQALLQGQGVGGDLHQARPARLRRRARADPRGEAEALYVFLPGGMGINFIKQFVAAGMSTGHPADRARLRAPTRTSSAPVGDADARPVQHRALGARPRQRRQQEFVAEFEKEYKRLPTVFAAQGYDTALLIDAAVREREGQGGGQGCPARGAEARRLQVGARRVQVQPQPVPDAELLPALVGKGNDGRMVNKTMGTVLNERGDAYVQDCKMK